MTIRPVSVIICTHNRAELLPNLISQLRRQDYPPGAYEIVVVDNRSTDATPEVVTRLAAESGASVRYIAEPGFGITRVRNRGAQEARFSYLAYVDDDCTVAADWLSHLMRGFDLGEHVMTVAGPIALEWNQPRPDWICPELEPWLADTSALGTEPRLLEPAESIVESNTVIARDAWSKAGGFIGMEQFGSRNMAASEIKFLVRQIRKEGGEIAFIPEAVMHHHINAPTRQQMIRRGYWQGVSDAMYQRMVINAPWPWFIYRAGVDLAAALVLFGYAVWALMPWHDVGSLLYLMRSARRVGLIFGELGLVGDGRSARTWQADTARRELSATQSTVLYD